ncbi:MAG TPA: Ig-like domain-containing protein, partial [Vicinamibacterales bacterium]
MALVVLIASVSAPLQVRLSAAMSLTAIAPLGASAGVSVQITGTGFDPSAANNQVTLTPASGPAVQVTAASITTLDASKNLRRIGITIPAGLAVGPAAVRVTNLVTHESVTGGKLDVVAISLPATASAVRGATQVPVRIDGSPNAAFVAGRTTVSIGAGVTVQAVQVTSPQSLVATISVNATAALGTRLVLLVTSTQTAQLTDGFAVTAPNRAPAINSTPPSTATESQPLTYQARATDPDGDAVTFRLVSGPSGVVVSPDGDLRWTPQSSDVGSRQIVIEASDGKGGAVQQTFTVAVAAAVTLTSIQLDPASLRLSDVGATRALSVTGRRSDGSTVLITSAAAGTHYESTNTFVARVDESGLLTSVGNGSATITARNGALSATAAVVVEAGVTLQSLDLTPAEATLRAIGAAQPLALRGRFSDGTLRDLTTDAGVTYDSSDAAIARVAANGLVTAVANGAATIVAHYDTATATAHVAVSVSSGRGFVRGEVYDDSKGLPLAGTVVTLLEDGSGPLVPGVAASVDAFGHFSIPAAAGAGVIRLSKSGFTTVDRQVPVPANDAVTAVDARLTPLDPGGKTIASALGGELRDAAGRFRLQIPAGALGDDALIVLTPLSGQGLPLLLPLGWSPTTAVAIGAPFDAFGAPVTLTLPNVAGLPAGTAVPLARYDADRHAWIVEAAAVVDPSGLTAVVDVTHSGAYVLLRADPGVAPAGAPGDLLAGLSASTVLPSDASATGEVVPRSAPPGDDARAAGRITAIAQNALPSGAIVHVRVQEQFDLLDQTHIVTQPFVEDVVLYQAAATGGAGSVGATFPITPSQSFTIQQLMLGVVRLAVTAADDSTAVSVVGSVGGTVTDADGDQLQVPAGALNGDNAIAMARLAADEAAALAPADADLIAAIRIDATGVDFAQPGTLTTAAPAGASGQDQFLLAAAFLDPFGQRRLRLVALLDVISGRLVPRAASGTVQLDGVRHGGDFFVVRGRTPLGFISGTVLRATSPLAGALVTSTATAFADVTTVTGHAVLPSAAGVAASVTAIDPPSGDRGASAATVTAAAVVPVSIAVGAQTFSLAASNPAADASNVPLDASLTLDFSTTVDPATLSAAAITLRTPAGETAAALLLSADRRRVTVRPAATLVSATAYSVILTAALRDAAGHALSPTAIGFTTLDTTRPATAAGRITAALPDADGGVLVSGSAGVAPAKGAVTLTNVRTQESITVLALGDGSFQARVDAVVGDTLLLVIRGSDGNDVSLEITQFVGPDGTTAIGSRGGVVTGPAARTATLLPNSLTTPGLFRLSAADTAPPALPAGFAVVDAFAIDVNRAVFNDLASLTLTDPQNRFTPQTASRAVFAVTGDLPVPADALVNSALRFTATAMDAGGTRRSADVSTTAVAANAEASRTEGSQVADFPTLFVGAPKQVVPGQEATIDAIAPEARLDLRISAPQDLAVGDTLWLTEAVTIGDEPRLVLVDRLDVTAGAAPMAVTAGRELPGARETGRYLVVRARTPLVLASGRVAGGPALVEIDGLPFVFRTSGPDGSFVAPVPSGLPFTLRVVELDGSSRGTITGTAPASGTINLGSPLAPTASTLTVTASLDDRSVVEIDSVLTFRFSEPIDSKSVAPAIVVVDPKGSRVFGTVVVSPDLLSAAFTPSRRWHFATAYRYGVAASIVAASGARQAVPLSGEFTTFAPVLLATVPQTNARDVAVNGSTVVVGAADGLAAVDWSNPLAPHLVGTTPIAGGISAVNLTGDLVDRNGAPVAGPLALAASGSSTSDGAFGVYQLPSGLAPSQVGRAQLTSAPGNPVPAGVIASAGTPRALVAGPDGRAFVAVEGVGLIAARLSEAIPPDASNPGRAVVGRYPPTTENITGTAVLGSRLVVAGAAGLAVLDSSLARTGLADTGGTAAAVAAAAGVRLDLNGDHTIEADREIVDVAVVAGTDGTVQSYRIPASGDPQLLSIVRLGSAASGVVLDPAERLAYVAAGTRGVVIVDLDGTAGIQPVDDDHDGIDDRILGTLAVPGAAARTAIDHARGIAAVAGGAGGLAVAQLLPPRTFIQSFVRDPLKDRTGDEQSIIDTHQALATDDGLRLTVSVASAGEPLSLVIQENPDAGGTSLLSFDNGAGGRDLSAGLNDIGIVIRRTDGTIGSHATLRVQTAAGRQIIAIDVTLLPVEPVQIAPAYLIVTPSPAAIPAGRSTVQLSAAAVTADGRLFNVTAASAGTTYASSDPRVATVDANGLVRAAAGGSTTIRAANHGASALVTVSVDAPPVIVALEPRNRSLTLVFPGLAVPLDVLARYSDGSLRDVRATGSAFRSSAPGVVEVTADDRVVAHEEGVAVVTVSNGAVQADIEIAVEFRAPAVLTGIALRPMAIAVRADDPLARAEATLAGSGALDGLPVTFTLAGASSRSASVDSNVDGIASIALAPLEGRGSLTVTATVVNPADGKTLSASQVVQTASGAGDVEPNDTPAAASRLTFRHPVSGSLDGASDVRDVYELDSTTDGTAVVTVSTATAPPDTLALSFLSADGALLQRVALT